jgi:outer membrane protein assembly factor BamB
MWEEIMGNALTAMVCVALVVGGSAAGGAEPAVESPWKSLASDFRRTGLSEKIGPETGCVQWSFETDGAVSASVSVGAGGQIHIPCEDGRLYTLDPNGSLLWSFDANTPLISSPSVGPDGTVYVGGMNGKLHAVDLNGSLLWTCDTGGLVYCSPAVSKNGKIYFGSQDGTFRALATDGTELWSFTTKGPGLVPSGSILASPAIGADGAIYVAGLYDPNLYALDPNDGSLKWTCNFERPVYPGLPEGPTEFGWPFASPVVAPDGMIYQTLLCDTHLYAIDPVDGDIIWSKDLADPQSGWFDPNYAEEYGDADGWSEPALGPDGTVYVSFDDPYLRAVDRRGRIKWVTRLGDVGGFTMAVGDDGLIYAAGDDGYLRVVTPEGTETARFNSGGWLNFPAITSDGVVIVADSRDNSTLINYDSNIVWTITAQCGPDQPINLGPPQAQPEHPPPPEPQEPPPPKGRSCFLGDTPVWIEGRLVRISHAISGQMAGKLDRDPATPSPGRIVRIEEHEGVFERYDVLLEAGDCIGVADSHYFLSTSGRWVDVRDLRAGTALQSLGEPVQVCRVTKSREPFAGKAFNLKIEETDRYFVGRDGIIVRDW